MRFDARKIPILFLQAVVVLVGIGVFVLILWEPHLEGRNAHATLLQIYFNDPFLAYVYAASIAFFVGLYQAFKVLGYIGRGEVFSPEAVSAVRIIKWCAFITAAAIAAAIIYIRIAHAPGDDPAGAVMLGAITTLASIIIGSAAAIFERILRDAVELKTTA